MVSSSIPMARLGGNAQRLNTTACAIWHDKKLAREVHVLTAYSRLEPRLESHSNGVTKAHQAYESGNGGLAHELSEEGKAHAAKMDQYNKQASDYIFRENNAPGRVPDDTIDLHGQFVEEAENIVEQRIRYAQQNGQTHLHVIVGKGNHSKDHVQKIKPKVEQVCRELGLQFATEENAGRMYINLQGGPAVMPPAHSYQQGGQQQHHGGNQQYNGGYQQSYGQQQQGGYPGGPQQGGYQQQGGQNQNNNNNNNNDELEKLAKKFLPKIIRKLEGCCTVM
ncbi:Smr domain-containing protein [Lachnellula hyalina]|uniref:Smr domain-containing protein n=1 Tax=Lachnellula hyalina TaxID=1316788 RepID=A0A8H8R359_9HELO|nr:Smr domain-containing protein [Lachnellula hyalina]TVY27588.1 Smr domain-containing protein [Lachnellula hyalina]